VNFQILPSTQIEAAEKTLIFLDKKSQNSKIYRNSYKKSFLKIMFANLIEIL
jgi:hypothetical protein